jgi:RNA-binding protein
MQLTDYQKKKVRRLAHNLKPVVMIGAAGLTENILREIESSLDHHELIKVRVSAEERQDRDQMINSICEKTRAELVQRIGHIAILFRRNAQKPKISLKKGEA